MEYKESIGFVAQKHFVAAMRYLEAGMHLNHILHMTLYRLLKAGNHRGYIKVCTTGGVQRWDNCLACYMN